MERNADRQSSARARAARKRSIAGRNSPSESHSMSTLASGASRRRSSMSWANAATVSRSQPSVSLTHRRSGQLWNGGTARHAQHRLPPSRRRSGQGQGAMSRPLPRTNLPAVARGRRQVLAGCGTSRGRASIYSALESTPQNELLAALRPTTCPSIPRLQFERLRRLHPSGLTVAAIARKLNDENVPTPRGVRWHSPGVKRALSWVRA